MSPCERRRHCDFITPICEIDRAAGPTLPMPSPGRRVVGLHDALRFQRRQDVGRGPPVAHRTQSSPYEKTGRSNPPGIALVMNNRPCNFPRAQKSPADTGESVYRADPCTPSDLNREPTD